MAKIPGVDLEQNVGGQRPSGQKPRRVRFIHQVLQRALAHFHIQFLAIRNWASRKFIFPVQNTKSKGNPGEKVQWFYS